MRQARFCFRFSFVTGMLLTAFLICGTFGCTRTSSQTPDQLRERALGLLDEGMEKEKSNDYKRAIEIYQQALALSPRPRTLYCLGHCYAETGDMVRAEEYLTRALQMQPDFTLAKYELQRVLDMKTETKTPVVTLAQSVTSTPVAHSESAAKSTVPEPKLVLASEGSVETSPTQKVETPAPSAKTPVHKAKPASSKTKKTGAKTATSRKTARTKSKTVKKTSTVHSTHPTTASKSVTRRKTVPVAQPATQAATDNSEPTEAAKKAAREVKPLAPAATPSPNPNEIKPPFETPTPLDSAVPNDEATTTGKTPRAKAHGFGEIHQTLFPEGQKPKKSKTDEIPSEAPAKTPPGTTGFRSDDEIVLGTFPYHFDKGNNFLSIKEYDKAINELSRATEIDPKNIDARLALGDAYAGKGRTQVALEQYQKALAIHPNDPKVFIKIGNLYAVDKSAASQAEAKQAYEKALQADPTNKVAIYKLGVLAMTNKNTNEAIRYFEQLLSIDEKQANAHLNLGILYGDFMHNKVKARQHYQRYIDLGGRRSDEVKQWLSALNKK